MGRAHAHSIASRNLDQFAGTFRASKFIRSTDDLVQCVQQLPLLINQQFRVTNNVHEQDMCDLKLDLFLISADMFPIVAIAPICLVLKSPELGTAILREGW